MKLPSDLKLEGTISRSITSWSVENCCDAEDQNNRDEGKLNSTNPHTEGPSLIGQELFHPETMDIN